VRKLGKLMKEEGALFAHPVPFEKKDCLVNSLGNLYVISPY